LLPLQVSREGEWSSVSLPHTDYPLLFEFLVYSPPGFVDPTYVSGLRLRGQQTFSFGPSPAEVLRRLGAQQMSDPRKYDPVSHARVTAKIGFAAAVAVGAIDVAKGRPPVVDSILGRVDRVGHWVGTLAEQRTHLPDALHAVTIHFDPASNVLFARVQYLADSGTPAYGVILGTSEDPWVVESFVAQSAVQLSCRWTQTASPE
jgi:hypothetical protein